MGKQVTEDVPQNVSHNIENTDIERTLFRLSLVVSQCPPCGGVAAAGLAGGIPPLPPQEH